MSGAERARYVQDMFARIARRYDLMNRVMTFGQDRRWRREVIWRAALPPHGRLLDLGAGTGDLAMETMRQQPTCTVVAADFTLPMIRVGQTRLERQSRPTQRLNWCVADAHCLPFPDASFEAVVSGFLLRNVSDVLLSLSEQRRVLKPGGMLIALDTTPPRKAWFNPLVRFHLHIVIPLLGRMLAGQQEAYEYLPDTTENFLEAEQLAARLREAGFQEVGFRRRMFGTIAIHWGCKPKE
jgi:demethylmenaquinone methyltransferase/2-methoxy-6-polyprenyl-1,4-benzoquinol methylase